MAQFPDIPLALTASAAFGADLTTAPSTWAFTDLTCTHPSNPSQTISRVAQDAITLRTKALIGAAGDNGGTSSGTLKLLNHDGAWTPGNPVSPHYPYIDEGLPIRLTITDRDTTPLLADAFTRTVTGGWGTSTSGAVWTSNSPTNTAVNGTAGTLTYTVVNAQRTLTCDAAPAYNTETVFDSTWPQVVTGSGTASFRTAMQLRVQANGDLIRPTVYLYTSGTVIAYLFARVAGVTVTITSQVVSGLAYTAGQTLRTRIRLQDDRIQMRVWAATGTEPTVWHLDYTGLPVHNAGGIGMYTQLGAGNTNTLPLTMSIDNLTVTALPTVRAELYVTDLQPTFEPSSGGFTWSTVTVSLGGVGSILEKRNAATQSPMRRSVQQAPIPPYAYWPLEDAQGSTSGASAYPDGPRMQVTGPAVFAFDGGTPSDEYLTRYGTKPIVSLAAGASMTVAVPTAPVQTEWAISWVSQSWSPGIPVAELRIIQWDTPGATYDRWALGSNNTGYFVVGYNKSSGTTVAYDLVTTSAGIYKEQVTWTVEAQQAGPNVSVELFANDSSLGSALFAATFAPITRVTLNPDAVNTTASVDPYGIKLLYGHLRVVQETFTQDTPGYSVPETGTYIRASTAWTREPAHRRVARLCPEERVALTLDSVPGVTGSTMLGAQRDGAFQDLLRAAVEAESGGLLHEHRFGYRMLPRNGRYNLDPALTVDLATYRRSDGTEQDAVLVPQLASRAPNYWTISRTGGSEGSWAADAAYRKRRGTVADERTLDLLSDDMLTDHARWRVHVGTDDRSTNYPVLPVDLAANPALIEAFKGLQIGARARRVNQPTIAGADTIDQVVEGITETLSPTSWAAELDVAPASVWEVGVYDDPLTRRDSSSTTLGAARDATQTAWTFSTAFQSDIWESGAVPYDVTCGGETVTVTTMGAPTGTGPYVQAATVVRSVNGVVKPQTAGTAIHIDLPAYRAL